MDDEGVSPVVGAILMTAIAVVMAALVWVLVTPQDTPLKDARIGAAEREGGEVIIVGVFGGDVLWEDVDVTGCDPHTFTGEVRGGEILTGCSGTVTIAHGGSVDVQLDLR